MGIRKKDAVLCCVILFSLWTLASALLSPNCINYEVRALIGIKESLEDPLGVLDNWVEVAVDPCSWTMVTCSPDYLVIALGITSQNLSGSLSPSIGNLTNLQIVLLQNNNISGPIPSELERLSKLSTLDLSNNFFTSEIPTSLSHMGSLQYLRLNNNSLSGAIPSALANMTQLDILDLSYNNLSGPVPRLLAKTFDLVGNPQLCGTGTEQDCCGMTVNSTNSQNSRASGRSKSLKIAFTSGLSLAYMCLLILGFGFLVWWRQKHSQNIDIDDQHHLEVYWELEEVSIHQTSDCHK